MNPLLLKHCCTGLAAVFIGIFPQSGSWDQDRRRMVEEQIRARGITDAGVLAAMQAVERHLFVPSEYREQAYSDRPLPIGYGQTISQPYIVAYMTERIRPRKEFKVLEIGTGSGYQAAILAGIVDQVFTVEIVPELASASAERLKKLGYGNVQVKQADGFYGWKEHAPYDAIVVTASADFVPPPLIEQLKPGGIMIIPVGSPFQVQMLKEIEKKNGRVLSRNLLPVRFVPFIHNE